MNANNAKRQEIVMMQDRKKHLLNQLEALYRTQRLHEYSVIRAAESALANPTSYTEQQLFGLIDIISSSIRRNPSSTYVFDSSFYPVMNGFKVGKAVDTGKVITISKQMANLHTLICGFSGAGKTNLINIFLAQVPDFPGLNYLVIDLKDDYKVHLALRKDVLVLNWNELRLNPLRPPKGVDYLFWLNVFIDIFSDIFGLAISSKGELLENLSKLYSEFGVDKGNDNYPSLLNLRDYLCRGQFSNSMQLRALKNRLSMILLTTNKVFDCSYGFSLEKLTQSHTIIRLHGLVEELQNFFLVYLLAWLFNHRIYNGIRNQGLSLLVFVDECKRLFSKSLESRTGSAVSSLSDSISKVREFGIGLVAADQEISKISRSLLANTYTKIIFDLNLGQDQDAITKAVGFNSAQKEKYVKGLGVGRAIIKCGANPPCLVEIPYYPLKEADVREEVRERLMTPFLDKLYADVIPVKAITENLTDYSGDIQVKNNEQNKGNRVSEKARKILADILNRPYEFVTMRMKSLKLSPTTFNKAKKELLANNLIEEANISIGNQRGKTAKFLIPTKEGIEFAGEKPLEGKGSAKHKFYAGAIREFLLAKGYKPQIEFFHNGKSVDVGYQDEQGKLVAIEITCSLKNLQENIEKDFEAGFNEICVVCDDVATEKKARAIVDERVNEENKQRVKIQQICLYF